MIRRVCAHLAFGVALLVSSPSLAPAADQSWELMPPNPKIEIEYRPPAAPRLEGVYEQLKGRKILEELQRFLAPLRLPHNLRLLTRQCDQVNAFYNGSDRSLTICYELVEELLRDAPQTISEDGFVTREAAIVGTLVGVVLHEGGHMLFDMLNVPVFGREEDAADQTASFIALQFSKDVERTIVKGFAYFWARGQDPSKTTPMSAWADEHGTSSQRMYNALCLAYGGDPDIFKEFVDRGWLPQARAAGCGQEFAQLKFAFVTTVLPFIDDGLMVKAQKTQWLTEQELQ
jgi:hypothetical protein